MLAKWLCALVVVGWTGLAFAIGPVTTKPSAKKTPKPAAPSAAQAHLYNAAVRPHMNDIRTCYMNRLKEGLTGKGRVLLFWLVDEKGKVTRIQAVPRESTLHDDKLNSCMIAKIKSWTWPVAQKGQVNVVRFPFDFNYKESPSPKKKAAAHH